MPGRNSYTVGMFLRECFVTTGGARPAELKTATQQPDDAAGDGWTRGLVLRCPAFWAHVLVVFVAFNMECVSTLLLLVKSSW